MRPDVDYSSPVVRAYLNGALVGVTIVAVIVAIAILTSSRTPSKIREQAAPAVP